MSLTSKQQFYVDTPEFNIPEGEIHSVYPPQGHEERAEALPHVVFNTPSFPWEWRASYIDNVPDYQQNRNRVPWLAVLVFTRNELELSPGDLELIQSKTQTLKESQRGLKQTSNLSIRLAVSAVNHLQHTASPVRVPESDPDQETDVILLRPGLFKSLFTKYDAHGRVEKTATHPDVRPFRFLAHRRDVNTQGMAVAALTATEDYQSSFSVVVSHRTGPFDVKEPTQCIVHLASIRGVETMAWPLSAGTRFVAISTLHSWTYTCIPPDTPSLKDQFVALGQSSALLRANVSLGDLPDTEGIPPAVRDRVLSRLEDGYTLARHRNKTGESTACLIRGPFIPVGISSTVSRPWHKPSTIGSDLQILDQQLGIMDITNSAAWQLGRTIAIADQDFVSRIGQVRKQIYDRGMQYAQLDALHEHGTRSRAELIAQLPSLVASLQQLPTSLQLATNDSHARSRRWHRPSVEPVDISYHGRQTASIQAFAKGKKTLKDYFLRAAKEVSSAVGHDPSQPSEIPYNEYNTPFSPDWMALLNWVIDRLFLEGIPPHYLVPDSGALPLESIRFFNIDWRWMDSLLDGALSLSNYTDQDHDEVREAIVAAIDLYRETKIPQLGNRVSPIPKYGCYVRSDLVTKFVDLKVDVISSNPSTDSPAILLSHKILLVI
ncbi:hypothetical protein MGU_11258 [Metarhizium guizhouense ARSEF 977]|uniref:Uncharacterized protein n=1 Tax=Metarhizium guizhouense (strain ARSEF 977) TaxID=1276136 RepID=A0A0B4GV34_METGA|nr:hypothetical protein MGU_11258 [Metarhizium guizhouense ARSEF 977]